MMSVYCRVLVALAVLSGVLSPVLGPFGGTVLGNAGARAQTAPDAESAAPLQIAVKSAEPFVMETENGYEGISIELWRRIAEANGIAYEFVATDLDGLLGGVADGRYSAGIAAITVTADREEILDFSHPFYTGGLGIAVPRGEGGLSIMGMLRKLVSPGFLTAIATLAVLLAVIGMLVWFVERKANPEQFGGNAAKGLGSGFWFSAVTMTTVGYGDKAPVSLPGRLLALIWMFASIIIISFFTGAIASAFTTSQLEGLVNGPKDLPSARVGAVEGSAAFAALRARGVVAQRFATVDEGLAALDGGTLDAFVHDDAILQYRLMQDFPGSLAVLEVTFERQPYAIALPQGSAQREDLNRAMLEVLGSPEWDALLRRYLENP